MGTIQCMKQREFLNRLFQISQLGGRPVCSFRPFIIYHARMCRNNTCAKTVVTHSSSHTALDRESLKNAELHWLKSLAAICPDGRTG